jgi:hypothetical protein
MKARPLYALAALATGFLAGGLLAQRSMGKWRSALFSARPLRRLAALGYLSGHPGVEAVQVLRDYLSWEEHPALRRRAEAIVRRMEAQLS